MPDQNEAPAATTTTRTVPVDGIGPVPVTVTERGQGRPFLLLHGGAGPQSVDGFATVLAGSGARVITPLHPGFGGSPRPDGLATMGGLAQLYVSLLGQLGLTGVTVIGNSIGGWIAAEIAVLNSPRVEAVHMRAGKVARGGIRWSDRKEDFRTEILGLMKAQTVKNVVIVPVGSKGGFIVKQPPALRDKLQAEAVECYKTLIHGLLDLTDNIVSEEPGGHRIVPRPDVVGHDDHDPYLVVAADKGTATFSDFANAISEEYGFWLGDAFASGGSAGYDHKEMGITARGAWELVKRHFRELGRNIESSEITVIGVGDMSGDVFGNGMLMSRYLRLLAAFDHRHVFVDPDPDAARSFAERLRLFRLPRSSWAEYDRALISPGGGVFERNAESIPISPAMKRAFDIDADHLTPAELIRKLLTARVDLLWFGGIGTYVKAANETHAAAGDRADDALRVNGGEIRAKVVAEGANLAVTQRGRVAYALAGGRIDPDAIDIEELKQRLMVIQALESARCVDEGVITDVREADVGSILGFGFAPFSGGTLSYIDMMGAKPFVEVCKRFEKKYGARFKPPKLLAEMAAKAQTFYGRFGKPATA